MSFYALNETTINGDLNHLGGGQFQVSVTCQGKASGVSGSASVAISVSAEGDFIQAPPGGMASIRVRGFARGKMAGRGIASAVVAISGSGNPVTALINHGNGQIVMSGSGTMHKTRIHYGHSWRNVSVVLARGNAVLRHLKYGQAQAVIELAGRTVITASIPETPTPAHPSRSVRVQAENRVMIVPPEKEQRGKYAAYSYVR